MYFERLKPAHHYLKVWGSVGVGKGGPNGKAGEQKENNRQSCGTASHFKLGAFGFGVIRACIVLELVSHF